MTYMKKDVAEGAAIEFGEEDVIMRALGMGIEQPEEAAAEA